MSNKPGEYAGTARVGARFIRNGREEDVRDTHEVFEPAKFESPPAVVTRGYGLTINLGNYESARFDVSIQMPCYPEDVDACDAWCAAWAEKRVEEETTRIRGAKPNEPKRLPSGGGW